VAGAESKPAASLAKPSLVLLRPEAGGPPVGPTVLQARPGATTVLINQGRSQLRQPTGHPQLAIDMQRLDPKTLLPKAGPQPARQ
jgi:hypothetical protein